MKDITRKRLLEAGWHENRNIDTELFHKKFDEIGLEYPPNVDIFLREYGMLPINPKDKRYFDVSFDVLQAIGCNLDGSYFNGCLEEYGIKKAVYPIGKACRNELFVLMTAENEFYGFTDGLLLFLGESSDEMLDCMVGECRDPMELE